MKKTSLFCFLLTILIVFSSCGYISEEKQIISPSPAPSFVAKEPLGKPIKTPAPLNNDNKKPLNASPASAEAPTLPIETKTALPPSHPPSPEPTVESTESFCTITVRCDDVLKNMNKLKPQKESIIPADGIILSCTRVDFTPGENAFEVLKRTLMECGIHMEFVYTPMYNSAYIEGIGNLYEFDCGDTSGWTYKINGESLPYGISQYILNKEDSIELIYICSFKEN